MDYDRLSLRPRILGIGSSESRGLRKGVVVDMEETINNVGEAVKQAESSAQLKIKRAYLAVNGLHLRTHLSRGVIAVSRADNEISENDVQRVVEAASIVSLPPNREIIHVLPKNFIIDGQEEVKNPVGMRGMRLEAEVLIVEGLSPYLRNLAKCLNVNNLEVAEFVFAPWAASFAVLEKEQKEHGVLNLDFGGGISTLSFFQEGELLYAGTLPIGSRHITYDLAVALRTSMEAAEKIKLNFAAVNAAVVGRGKKAGPTSERKDEIDLSDLAGEEDFVVSKKNVHQVVEARISDFFDLVQNELKKIPQGGMIPAGVVLTGGGVKLAGLYHFAKERLKLPIKMNGRYEMTGEKVLIEQDPAWAVVMGLALYGLEKDWPKKDWSGRKPWTDNPFGFLKKISERFKDFIP